MGMGFAIEGHVTLKYGKSESWGSWTEMGIGSAAGARRLSFSLSLSQQEA